MPQSRLPERLVLAVLVLMLVYVALRPGVSYAPVQRTVLFAVLAVAIGISLGSSIANSEIKLNLGWMVATYAGAPAVVFGLIILLTKLSAPDRQIALYHVLNPQNEKYNAISEFGDQVISVETDHGGISTRPLVEVDGNAFALVFPEQVPTLRVGIRFPPATGKWYYKTLTYTGEGGNEPLVIGVDLKERGK